MADMDVVDEPFCAHLQLLECDDKDAWGPWTSPKYEANFREEYARWIDRTPRTIAGVAPIRSSTLGDFDGDRVMHWTTSGGVLCLREVWLGHHLLDSAVCLRLGQDATNGFPFAVHFESLPKNDQDVYQVDVMACFLMVDNTVYRLRLHARSANESVLANLVSLHQGGVVSLADEIRRGRPRGAPSSLSTYEIRSVPETCSVVSATWQSRSLLVLGLTQGGILGVSLDENGAEESFLQPVQTGAEGGFVSNLLHSIPQWWGQSAGGVGGGVGTCGNGLQDNSMNILALASYSKGCVSIDAECNLKLWDDRTRRCVSHVKAVHVLRDDALQDHAAVCGAKICLLHDVQPNVSSLLVGVALKCQQPGGGRSSWHLGIYTLIGPRLAYQDLGELHGDAGEGMEEALIDMQFSAAVSSSQDFKYCLNMLWQRCGTNVLKAVYFGKRGGGGGGGGGGEAKFRILQVRSNRDKLRTEMHRVEVQPVHRAEVWNNRDELSLLKRVFVPGRFSIRTIIQVLIRHIPFSYQLPPEQGKDLELPGVLEWVRKACNQWGDELYRGGDNCGRVTAYLEFLNLCHEQAMTEDYSGPNCLLAVRECFHSKYKCFVSHSDGLGLVAEVPFGPQFGLEGSSELALHLSKLKLEVFGHFENNLSIDGVFLAGLEKKIRDFGATLTEQKANQLEARAAAVDWLPCVLKDVDLYKEMKSNGERNFNAFDLKVLVTDIARTTAHGMCVVNHARALALAKLGSADAFKVVVHNFVYANFLVWLDTVRLTSDESLQCVDLEGVYPGSHLLASRLCGGAASAPSDTSSVFSHFWTTGEQSLKFKRDEFDANDDFVEWIKECSRRCMFAMRPSTMSDLAAHLVRHRQFSCLSRLASFLAETTRYELPQMSNHLASFFRDMLESRIRCMETLALFLESLRRHDYDDLANQSSRLLDAALAWREMGNEDIPREELEKPPQTGFSLDAYFDIELARKQAVQSTVFLDSYYCVHDALMKMASVRDSPFSVLMNAQHRNGKINDQFLSQASVRNVCHSAFLADVVDVFRRASGVLPVKLGSQICKMGGDKLMTSIDGLKFFFRSDDILRCLDNADLATYSRMFNAALDALDFEVAWEAVLNMLEKEGGKKSVMPQWLVCLRSLVIMACDTGRLEWLCALPNALVNGVWLADYVAKELDRLAKMSGIDGATSRMGTGAGGAQTINYYECLYAFHLSRDNYIDAAHAMLAFSERDDNFSSRHKSRSLAVALSALCSSKVPPAQRHLTSTISRKTSFVSAQMLSLRTLIEQAKAATGLEVIASDQEECLSCVEALCRTNRLKCVLLAVDLAKQAELVRLGGELESPERHRSSHEKRQKLQCSRRSDYVPRALEVAIEGLVRLCIRPAEQRALESQALSITFSSDVDKAPQDELLAVLCDVLATQDDSAYNWALSAAALDSAVSSPSSPASAQVRQSLITACRLKPGSAWLMSYLLSKGLLVDACAAAQQTLEDFRTQPNSSVSYAKLDKLLECCDASGDRDALAAGERIRISLSEHFKYLVGVES